MGSIENMPERDARRATTWRGDFAIHTQAVIDAAVQAGEKIHDENGDYIGLTYDRVIELLEELKVFREGNGVKLLGNALTARTDELTALRHEVSKLRWWIHKNTNLSDVMQKDDVETLETARALMDVARTVVVASWPVLTTMWGNLVHTLTQAGLIKRGEDGAIR